MCVDAAGQRHRDARAAAGRHPGRAGPAREAVNSRPGHKVLAPHRRDYRLPVLSSPMTRQCIFATWTSSRSEEHTSELQSLMRISYAVFCLKQKKHIDKQINISTTEN